MAAPSLTFEAVTGDDLILVSERNAVRIGGTVSSDAKIVLMIDGLAYDATIHASGTNLWSYLIPGQTLGTLYGRQADIVAIAYNGGRPEDTTSITRHILYTDRPGPTIDPVAGDDIVNLVESHGFRISGATPYFRDDIVKVELSFSGQTRAANANPFGSWFYDFSVADIAAMGQGPETLTVTATNSNGQIYKTTETRTFNVDTRLAEPTISPLAGDDIVTLVDSNSAVLRGTIQNGSLVKLYLGNQERQAQINGSSWSYTLTAADYAVMGQGDTYVIVSAYGPAAPEMVQRALRKITIDTKVSAPTIDLVAGDDVVDKREAVDFVISGTADKGAAVKLKIGTLERDAAVSDGKWTYKVTAADVAALGDGKFTVAATAYAAKIPSVAATATRAIEIDTSLMEPTIHTIAGDNVVNLVESQSLVLTGATDGSAVKLSFSGQERMATVSGSSWSYKVTTEDLAIMGQGAEVLTATYIESKKAGASETLNFSIDTIAPKLQKIYSSTPYVDNIIHTYGNRWFFVEGRVEYTFDESVKLAYPRGKLPYVTFEGSGFIEPPGTIYRFENSAFNITNYARFSFQTSGDGVSGQMNMYITVDALDQAGNVTSIPTVDSQVVLRIQKVLAGGPPVGLVTRLGELVVGVDLTSEKATMASVTTPGGLVVDNPLLAAAKTVAALQDRYANGSLSLQQAAEVLIDIAMPTTGVSLNTYRFFTGEAPWASGLDWLIDSPENPTDLTDGFYAGLNLVNRHINLSVGLGTVGEGKTAFAAAYGDLNFQEAVAKAYEEVIGVDEATEAGIDVPAALAWINSQQSYFSALGGSDMGAKAAMVGYVMAAGAQARVGDYYELASDYITSVVGLAGGVLSGSVYLDG